MIVGHWEYWKFVKLWRQKINDKLLTWRIPSSAGNFQIPSDIAFEPIVKFPCNSKINFAFKLKFIKSIIQTILASHWTSCIIRAHELERKTSSESISHNTGCLSEAPTRLFSRNLSVKTCFRILIRTKKKTKDEAKDAHFVAQLLFEI